MKKATISISGVSPICYGKYHQTEKLEKELHEAYEKRTWREKTHYDIDTKEVYIPASAIKNSLAASAKYLSLQIPGKGKSTYTKHFEAGILILENMPINQKLSDAIETWYFVPSDGIRGGTKRVMKCFPTFKKWSGTIEILIFDGIITKDVLQQHLDVAGSLIGLLTFRPRNNGYHGRFDAKVIDFK